MGSNVSYQELERRKQQIRDLWSYRRLNHVPIWLSVNHNPLGYSLQEQLRSPEKQLAVEISSIEKTLELVPDDYIPVINTSPFCGHEVGVALGAELMWAEDEEQPPYPYQTVINKSSDVHTLIDINWLDNPFIDSWLERVSFIAKQTDWPLVLNLLGPTDTALSISEQIWFYESIILEPKTIFDMYDVVAETMSSLTDAAIARAGNRNRVSGLGARLWCPEGHQGYVSDDVGTHISPKAFEQLDLPTNDKIFKKYGQGVFHICGPHPSAHLYLNGKFPPCAVTASWRYTKDYLPTLAKFLAKKAVLYLELTDYEIWNKSDFSSLIDRYRYAVDCFTPSTLVVAYLQVGDQVNVPELYAQLRAVSENYAARMDWKDVPD